MRKIIGIGEAILDILFRNNQVQAAVPGGSVYNALISLGRMGMDVTFISETGNDPVGKIILENMRANGVHTGCVNVFSEGKSPVSLAFLNEQNDAGYVFYKDYPSRRLDVALPDIQEDDIVMMGSYFAVTPALREKVKELLDLARERGAIVYYDVNFRSAHAHEAIKLMPFILENFEYTDIRNGIVAAVSIKVEEPVFESQTKTKLGSRDMGPDGPTVSKFINDFLKKELDNFLHINGDTAEIMLRKITESEKERKAMAGITKLARERSKKVSLHNRKLRDCHIHYNDPEDRRKNAIDRREESCIFITEGDSATGTITQIRDVETQAVFSLRGKPLNSYGLTQKVVYENEEFNLLQAALNIEEGIEGLRYNKVIIATDADVDGMHIRLLLLTFLLQFFPDLVKKGHVYVLQTPLFRVRNKHFTPTKSPRGRHTAKDAELVKTGQQPGQEVYYCYTDEERIKAIESLGNNAEITRFKGLGEISKEEFKLFIGPDIRLDRVMLRKEDLVNELLEFYMGNNTMERQNFIIDNLVIEDDTNLL